MNKKLKIALSVVLCICSLTVAVPTAVYLSRGSINSYELPKGFEEGISKEAFDNKADIRVMSSNLLVHYESWGGEPVKPRAKMYTEVLEKYQPDVVGIQELCDSWYCCLKHNLPDGYKMIYPLSTGAFVRMTAMVYNSNTVDLIKDGTFAYAQGDNPRLRRVVWGVFRVKETGKVFAATSTHFDLLREGREEELTAVIKSQSNELISFVDALSEEYDCPVISVGDFNTMEDTPQTKSVDIPEIYYTLAQKYTDAKFNCDNQVCGELQPWDYPSYDHIFMTSGAKAETFALLSYDWLNGISDHYPIFADINI